MKYKDTLKKLYEGENMEYTDALDIDKPEQDTSCEECYEISLASQVKVKSDANTFIPEDLGMDEDQFEDFKNKVLNGETALVFDENDDNPTLVSIVYEDGLEAFDIPKVVLELVSDEIEDEE